MNEAAKVPQWRGIFCNRTLNLRSIRAIGYDMDYTLIHYHVEEWERRAFEYLAEKLAAEGMPVGEVRFDPDMAIRGLSIDRTLGNIVKSNRYGWVIAARHGTRALEYDEWRAAYATETVDLTDGRYRFINTLFGVSEACMYAQLVDLFDAGQIPQVRTYAELHQHVRASLDEAHMEGRLKAEIVADPERFVELEPELPLALLDQKHAGKKLLLITNSEWAYTQAMMTYAFDRFLPEEMTWRDLFDLTMVAARKPAFFIDRLPALEIVSSDGLLRPHVGPLELGGRYHGGHGGLVEEVLGLSGDQILYVGDHVYGDVHVSKQMRRWRTALILRELEGDIQAVTESAPQQGELGRMMEEKTALEREQAALRLQLLRKRYGYGPPVNRSRAELDSVLSAVRDRLAVLDSEVAPLAKASAGRANERWGLVMRAGQDKSHMARHVERHADIYTSRVSNFLGVTPYAYLRAARASLPHD